MLMRKRSKNMQRPSGTCIWTREGVSEEDFLEMTREFTLEKRRMAGMLLQAKEELTEVEARIEAGDAKELMQQYINVDHLTREMVEKLVDHINVGRRIPGTRTVPVEIHWNF